ncbi:hypothetical protein BGZ72_003683 [Mortierella alpina]|nr:hypothetical protein BGZ72_003683 [Mortierella alpina]
MARMKTAAPHVNEFAHRNGSCELMAVWTVSLPAFTRVRESTTARISIKNSEGGRMEKSGCVTVSEEHPLSYDTQIFELLFCAKIRIKAGDRVEAKLEVAFDKVCPPPPTNVEYISDDSNDNRDSRKYGNNNDEEEGNCNTGTVLQFELRSYDPQVIQDASTTYGFIPIIVQDEVNIALELIPESIKNNPGVSILTTCMSQDHDTLAILSAATTAAVPGSDQTRPLYIEVWDLVGLDGPDHPREPASSVTLQMGEQDVSLLSVTTSPNGEFVAVFQKPCRESTWMVGDARDNNNSQTFPPRLFQRQLSNSTSNTTPFIATSAIDLEEAATNVGIDANASTQELQELEHAATPLLSSFVGFAKFQHRSPEDSSSTNSRREFLFITCDGRYLDIYKTKPKIKPFYTISLMPLSFTSNLRESCKLLISTLHDTLFAWRAAETDKGTLVWNWRTGKCIGHFPPACTVSMPIDESVVIITKGGYTAAYSTANGSLCSSREIPGVHRDIHCDARGELNGKLTMLMTDEKTTKKTLRMVDPRNVEDFTEIEMDIFTNSSRPWHVSQLQFHPHATGTIVTSSPSMIEFFDIRATSSCTGSECDVHPMIDWLGVVGPDRHHGQTFKFSRTTDKRVTWIRRVIREDESKGYQDDGETVLEFKSPGRDGDWSGLFLSCGQRFLIVTPTGFELWRLPITQSGQCSLLAMRIVRGDFQLCHHGVVSQFDEAIYDTATNNFIRPDDTAAFVYRIREFTANYNTFPETYRTALVEFAMRHINKDVVDDASIAENKPNRNKSKSTVMWRVVLECVLQGRSDFLRAVLQSRHYGHWIPRESEFSANADNDMIAFLVYEFQFPIARLLIDYCIARAQSTDVRFMEILMTSVPHLMTRYLDEAFDISRRAAFIPVRDKATVLQLAVHNGSQWRWRFWRPAKTSLHEVMNQNPVFRLRDQIRILHTSNRIEQETMSTLEELHKKNTDIKANLYVVPFSLIWTVRGQGEVQEKSSNEDRKDDWVSTLLRVFRALLYPGNSVYVGAIYSNLDVFDNLALSALMKYKWTRFARGIWIIQLALQVTYDFLVVSITFLQIYGHENLLGGYIAIIYSGYLLLLIERHQMKGGVRRYFSSPYNYIDLLAYIIPVASSCALIADPENVYALRALSFSVILVYLHFMFELRVFKNVCKVVTIVVNILLHIPAFFVILAIFILAFAHSINHLTESNYRSAHCLPNEDGTIPRCQTMRDEFPLGYFQSVSAAYFIMTGDYSSVQTSLLDGHWTCQLMVGLYFFLTAVLMLNVVIALMNGVYGDAVIAADQIWLKNRLEHIAFAESLFHALPYFRDRFYHIPKDIYYTATDKDVKDYRKKYLLDKRKLEFDFSDKPEQEVLNEKKAKAIEAGLQKVMDTKLSELQRAHEEEMRKLMSFLSARLPEPTAGVVATAEKPSTPSSPWRK